jgi:hypothetical protein
MAGRPKLHADMAWLRDPDNFDELISCIEELGTVHKALVKLGKSNGALVKVMGENADLANRVLRARQSGASKLADETVDIADDLVGDPLTDQARVAALQISSRQWLASRLNRAELGDKMTVDANVSVTNLHLLAVKGKAVQQLTAPVAALPAPEDDVIDVEPLPLGLADLL